MTEPPIRIDSLDDRRIEVFRNVRDRDLRGRQGVFIGESEMVLRRSARPDRVLAVLLSPTKHAELAEALRVLSPGVPVYVAPIDLITRIAGFPVHRGVLAAGQRPSPAETSFEAVLGHVSDRSRALLVLAEGLTNVDNVGALFRNAAAFGADGILLDPTSCDPLYRKAVRVSMGHVLSVPYGWSADWLADLERLRAARFTLVAAEVTPDARPIWEIPDADRIAVVLGSEGDGIGPSTLAACHMVCRIPMAAAAGSINVAAAAAVALYEVCRVTGRLR